MSSLKIEVQRGARTYVLNVPMPDEFDVEQLSKALEQAVLVAADHAPPRLELEG